MKLVIVCCLFSTLFQVGTAFSLDFSSLFGEVGALTAFEFYNNASGTSVLTSVYVDGNVTESDIQEFLTYFDSEKDTKIIIHGWLTNDKQALATSLIGAYVTNYDYNVIFVDWSPEAYQLYRRSVQAVPKIANNVASLVIALVANYSASLDQIHIVGHSLGAHIAGIAGLNISSVLGEEVGRITGLDPAHPLFTLAMTDRLSNETAKFVDVIHTCKNLLSFSEPLGHVDFYPNGGGAIQPGCGLSDLLGGTCSHSRSYLYFAESITDPDAFLATECETYDSYKESGCDDRETVYMGESVAETALGTYFLTTNKKSPYGISTTA